MIDPNPAKMLGASFVLYTGDVDDIVAIGPELSVDHLELTRCFLISPQVYHVLERYCAGPTGRRGFG